MQYINEWRVGNYEKMWEKREYYILLNAFTCQIDREKRQVKYRHGAAILQLLEFNPRMLAFWRIKFREDQR